MPAVKHCSRLGRWSSWQPLRLRWSFLFLRLHRHVAAGGLALAFVAIAILPLAAQQRTEDLFRAKALVAPTRLNSFPRDASHDHWDFADGGRAGFTKFSDGITDIAITTDKSLKFQVVDDSITLGWGNYAGQQPLTERVHLWDGPIEIQIKARQSDGAATTWDLLPWCDGLLGGKTTQGREERRAIHKGSRPEGSLAQLSGADWQTLVFPADSIKHPDGFEIVIHGAHGRSVEIASVQVVQEVTEGWFRKEFDLPVGRVWRAVAEVGNQTIVHVNGQLVPGDNPVVIRPSHSHVGAEFYQSQPIDLAAYLKPGRNVIALYGRRLGTYSPYIYFQSTVTMESGEVLRIDSDESWQYSPTGDANFVAATVKERAYLNLKDSQARPVYDGRIVLEHPSDRLLFFGDVKPVEIVARIPPAYFQQRPELSWHVDRYENGGFAAQASGMVREFEGHTPSRSVRFQLPVGQLPRGIYTLRATLTVAGKVLETRDPEPFVVVGKLPMREVAGDRFDEGLDLVLEDSIDFTDLKSGRESMETDGAASVSEPTIVSENGLQYRQTGSNRGALFSHVVTFQHPGEYYLLELDYPDDKQRWFGVSLTSSTTPDLAKAGPSVWTGHKYPLSGRMQTLRWIYRPDPGPTAINISNIAKDFPGGAASTLRIHWIRDGLPALKVDSSSERRIGVLTERCAPHGNFARTFGFVTEPESKRGNSYAEPGNVPVEQTCRALERYLDASEGYARYLRFTGQNLHVMGAWQYYEGNTAFVPLVAANGSRIPNDLRDVAVRVFGANDIAVMASVEYVAQTTVTYEFPANDGEVALGADTVSVVDREGRQPWVWLGRYGWNFQHPRVQAVMLDTARALADKFADQPHFLGVNWTSYLSGDYQPAFGSQGTTDPFTYSFDDVTIALFQRQTGIEVPGEPLDPGRFARRADFLTSPAHREQWIQWRCEKLREFFAKLELTLHGQREDLAVSASLYFDINHAIAWKQSGEPLREYLRSWGWDPQLFRDSEHTTLPHWMHATLRYAPTVKTPSNEAYAAGWAQNTDPQWQELFNQGKHRAVMIVHHWQEHERFAQTLPEREGWPRPFQATLQAQASGDFAREPFTAALITDDPQTVMFGFNDLNLITGHEQELREFARVLTALPSDRFTSVLDTSLTTNIAIRQLKRDDGLWFYVVNPAYWPIRGRIVLSGTGAVTSIPSGERVETATVGGQRELNFDLPPYGVAAFRVAAAQAVITSWNNEPIGDADLAHLRSLLDTADQAAKRPIARRKLTADELAFVQQTIRQARADLESGRYASAWYGVIDWRFWTITQERLAVRSRPYSY